MTLRQILEVEGQEVGVLEPHGDLLVFRATASATQHLDGYAYSEPQAAYTDVRAQVCEQPAHASAHASGGEPG
jgi:hypothetical protein